MIMGLYLAISHYMFEVLKYIPVIDWPINFAILFAVLSISCSEFCVQKRDQQLRRKSGGGSGAKDSKTRRRSTHMDVFGVDIIRYIPRGSGLHHHYVFEVKVSSKITA